MVRWFREQRGWKVSGWPLARLRAVWHRVNREGMA